MTGPADSLDLPRPERDSERPAPLEPGTKRFGEFEITGPLLTDVVDGRGLQFDVEVREGERAIGVGTHRRRVIRIPPAVG
jgi:hypothetical protein